MYKFITFLLLVLAYNTQAQIIPESKMPRHPYTIVKVYNGDTASLIIAVDSSRSHYVYKVKGPDLTLLKPGLKVMLIQPTVRRGHSPYGGTWVWFYLNKKKYTLERME